MTGHDAYAPAVGSSIRTLLFSDVEGSTALLQRVGDRYGDLLGRYRLIMRDAISAHRGVEHGTEGDSFFVSFDSPLDAVAAAVQMQRGLQIAGWPQGCEIKARIGLHVGEVTEQDGGLIGLAVHHAARVAAAAHGGQLIISDDVRRLTPTLPAEVTLRGLGEHRLRDLGIIALFQVLHPALAAEFPPLRAMPTSRSNLPRFVGSLVGAAETFGSLLDAARTSPLLTLTGTGGVGKTRLAVELARRLVDEHDDGAWLVELGQLSEPEAVVAVICNTLSIPPQPELTAHESMIDWLRGRSLRLVVDNCEHLIDEVASVVAALIAECAEVRIIATSREPIGIAGEQVHRVASLDDEHAADLFIEQITAADRSISLGSADRALVLEICRRLDGIPLAIQLAAARATSLSLTELLDRLGDRFRLLRGGTRGGRERHQTLQATVTWSYQLLSLDEQLVFDRASVFAGDFDLPAAEHICSGEGIEPFDVIDLLAGLVDKSMLTAQRAGASTRYRLLETLRQYGEDRLDQRGSLATARDRHLEWYARVAATADGLARTAREQEGYETFDVEWANLRSAHTWALASEQIDDAIDLCTSCFFHCTVHDVKAEHSDWVGRTLAALPEGHPLATRLLGLAACWRGDMLGDSHGAHQLARRGIELAVAADHADTLACWIALAGANDVTAAGSDDSEWAFRGLCAAVDNLEDPDREWWSTICVVDVCLWSHMELVDSWSERVRQTARRVQSPNLDLWVDYLSGQLCLSSDPPDFAGAMPHYLHSLDRARRIGAPRAIGQALRGVAMASCGLGEGVALARSMEALDSLLQMRFWQKVYQTLESSALALALDAHLDDAAVVLGFLDAEMPQGFGIEASLGFRRRVVDLVASAPRREPMIARGAAMSRDDLVAFVLTESAGRNAG